MHYGTDCIKNSFEFAGFIKNCYSHNKFMSSFDICSLFTCVPILETINICADMLYRAFRKAVFVELMKFATTSVEFNFNNIMYRQVDGISMGSVLGPTMAGIFVGFHEVDLFSKCTVSDEYFRSVEVTFSIFGSETEACKFFSHLNKMHPSHRFTLEKESNFTLPFLDVLVYKDVSCFLTSVYPKPTFTGLYFRWDSFCPKKHKLNLIKTLIHRALMTCSESKLDCEVRFITETLCNNGFPEDVRSIIMDKIAHFYKTKVAPAQKCPVYLRPPWLGDISDRFAHQISACAQKSYFSSNLRVVFRTRTVLPSGREEVHPHNIFF